MLHRYEIDGDRGLKLIEQKSFEQILHFILLEDVPKRN